MNCEKKVHFVWIRNEDAFDWKGRFPKGAGPSLLKIKMFNEIVERFARRDVRVAVYCGAGEGRTSVYLASYLVLSYNKTALEAIDLIVSGLDERKEKIVRYQMWENWGEDTLKELASSR